MALNEQQENAVHELNLFTSDVSKNFIALEGFAGTGKTFTIQHFLKEQARYRSVCVTAPTNKAVSVLRDFGREVGVKIPSKTIYSSLGLVLSSDNEVRECTQGTDGDFNEFQIVVIDETSMLNRKMTRIIQDRVMHRQKVIFMGDPYQLNPVHEAISPSFTLGQTLRLAKVMRQEEGALLELIADVRQQCIDGSAPSRIQTSLNDNDDGVHLMFGNEFFETAAWQFQTDEYRSNPSFARYLAWTNAEVKRFNRYVRAKMFGPDAPTYIVGEHVTTLSPVFDMDDNLLFCVDDEAQVTFAEEAEMTDYLDTKMNRYKVWRLTLESADGRIGTVITLHPGSVAKYTRRCQQLANECHSGRRAWRAFWDFKEMFTDVRHLYGMTVHRSQGQTIENVFVNAKDFFGNKRKDELRRLIYVALSRASKNVILNKNLLTVS